MPYNIFVMKGSLSFFYSLQQYAVQPTTAIYHMASSRTVFGPVSHEVFWWILMSLNRVQGDKTIFGRFFFSSTAVIIMARPTRLSSETNHRAPSIHGLFCAGWFTSPTTVHGHKEREVLPRSYTIIVYLRCWNQAGSKRVSGVV